MYCPGCGKEIPDGSTFCLHCGKAATVVQAPPSPTTPAGSSGVHWAIVSLVILLLIGGVGLGMGVLVWLASSSLEPAETAWVPVSQRLTSGQTVVPAGKYFYVKFHVSPGSMRNARVVGSFHTSGGSGNDIQAVLAEESEWENWINGHNARVLYSTEKTTNGKLDVPITEEGTYYLAFNNAFSIISDKYVFAEIELRYDRSK